MMYRKMSSKLTSRNAVLLAEVTASQMDEKFSAVCTMWIFIPLSHEPVTCDYFDPNESSARHLILYLWDPSEIFPSIQTYSFQEAPSVLVTAPKPCRCSYSFPWQIHAPPIFILLDLLFQRVFGEKYETWSL